MRPVDDREEKGRTRKKKEKQAENTYSSLVPRNTILEQQHFNSLSFYQLVATMVNLKPFAVEQVYSPQSA